MSWTGLKIFTGLCVNVYATNLMFHFYTGFQNEQMKKMLDEQRKMIIVDLNKK